MTIKVRHQHAYCIECDQCEDKEFRTTELFASFEEVKAVLEGMGWAFSKDGKEMCPKCNSN